MHLAYLLGNLVTLSASLKGLLLIIAELPPETNPYQAWYVDMYHDKRMEKLCA
jgi:hypothetical protein